MVNRREKLQIVTEKDVGEDVIIDLEQGRKGPVFRSEGDTDFLCGGCDVVLVGGFDDSLFKRLLPPGLRRLVVRCDSCRSLNLVHLER